MEMAWDPSMRNLMARRIMKPGLKKKKSHHHTLSLSFTFFSLFCLSHASSYTQICFIHKETWQQISVSILNLINGNDSSVIHLSWVAFLFLSLRGERTLFGWRPSLVIAHNLKAWCLENIFCVIRHKIILCLWLLFFWFWHLCLI